jgi:carboxyl-terminal processing protease
VVKQTLKKFHGLTVVLLIVAAMAVGSMLTVSYIDHVQSKQASSHHLTEDEYAKRGSGVLNAADGSNRSGAAQPSDKDWEKLKLVYQMIESSFYEEVDREKLIDGAIRGMVTVLGDPYTVYMNPEEAEQFTAAVDSTFSGIGAEVTMIDGKVTVVSAIKDSPAERAGIMAKDTILSVNNESLSGLTLSEAVAKIRGPKGTVAKLEIMREGYDHPIEITVIRDDIGLETVFSRMADDEIGIIELRQFVQNSDQRFQEEFEQLKKQGMRGLIIDVRDNPGGYLYSVIDLLDLLLPEGKTIVQVENRDGERQVTSATGDGIDIPIVVLINEGSASASEILAAALQENGKAKLVGQRTFGKGTVQSTYSKGFKDGSNMKITIAKWLTPKGNFIHETGVQPDIEVALPDYFNATSLPKDRTLEMNQNNAMVANLQLMLKALGYDPGRLDGYFSEETANAVKRFQADHELEATGAVDAETASKIEEQLIGMIQDPANDTQLQTALRELKRTLGIGE